MKKTSSKKVVKARKASHTNKKHSQQFLKVYWPYIPLFVLVFFGLTFGYNWRGAGAKTGGSSGVLAYATEIGGSALQSATNSQRSQNGGLSGLTINSKLNSAAQAKADDMVARNYWSHNTPDGKEPWTFMDAAGYSYQKAGENLAYGFTTSNDTVIGWMNSPGHRANILDTSYKEVGFGYANSTDFVGTGQETIVVAMYGNPMGSAPAAAVNTSTPAAAPVVKSAAKASQPAATQPTIEDTVIPAAAAVPTTEVVKTPTAQVAKKLDSDRINQAVTSDSPISAAQPAKNITKLQTITRGYAPWSSVALSVVVVGVTALWVLKHVLIVKRVLVDGEEFLLHHPIIDVGVLSIVAIAILLSQSSGVIK
jgi:hypothetical protein